MNYSKSKSTKRFSYTIDRNDTAKQVGLWHARRVECRISALEQLPLLRVHSGRLGSRYAKATVLKEFCAV